MYSIACNKVETNTKMQATGVLLRTETTLAIYAQTFAALIKLLKVVQYCRLPNAAHCSPVPVGDHWHVTHAHLHEHISSAPLL